MKKALGILLCAFLFVQDVCAMPAAPEILYEEEQAGEEAGQNTQVLTPLRMERFLWMMR